MDEGYQSDKIIFKKLVTVDEARRLIKKYINPKPLGIEIITLENALYRVLAEDIIADIDVPPFDRAMRDGYGVRSRDLIKASEYEPVKLRVVDVVSAGNIHKRYLKSGEAIKISTGAPIPGGVDSIIMEEYTRREGDYVYVYKRIPPGEWVQFAGSDIMRGEPVLKRGVILTSREIGVLAALGKDKIKVYRKPRVAIVSTGDELVKPGEMLKPASIYDVNSYMIYTAVFENGGEPYILGISRDDPDELKRYIIKGVKEFDILILSGSTSVGTRDNLFRVLSELNARIIFYGVKSRPGKPTLAALLNGKPIVGLPGFPVSCIMIFDSIFSSMIRAFSGLPESIKPAIKAKAGYIIRSELGIRQYYPVFTKVINNTLYFYPMPYSSGAIATFTMADGYIEIPEDTTYIDFNDEYTFYPFTKEFNPSNMIIITSHSIAFDMLIHKFTSLYNYNIKVIYAGSTGGLVAIRDGYNDVAGTHLMDEITKEYNIPFIRRYNVKNAILYRGFKRLIGFVVKPSNPKNIRSFRDLIRSDVRFINRSSGSGTRVFIDINLKILASELNVSFEKLIDSINGYYIEAKTHSAVVSAVEYGKADVGIATKLATVGRNVDFIPLTWEYYDFLFNKTSITSNNVVSEFKRFLESNTAVEILKKLNGIDIPEDYMNVLIET